MSIILLVTLAVITIVNTASLAVFVTACVLDPDETKRIMSQTIDNIHRVSQKQ